MLNNIDNNSNSLGLNSQLVRQDSMNRILGSASASRNMSNPIDNSNFLIDSSDISNKAMKMYEREQDIQKFTRLATSDPENTSADERVQELFKKGVVDVFEDSTIASLSSNKSLLDDLGL